MIAEGEMTTAGTQAAEQGAVTWKRLRGMPGPQATLNKTVVTPRQGSRLRLGAVIVALVRRLLTLQAGCCVLPFLQSGPLEDIATERVRCFRNSEGLRELPVSFTAECNWPTSIPTTSQLDFCCSYSTSLRSSECSYVPE